MNQTSCDVLQGDLLLFLALGPARKQAVLGRNYQEQREIPEKGAFDWGANSLYTPMIPGAGTAQQAAAPQAETRPQPESCIQRNGPLVMGGAALAAALSGGLYARHRNQQEEEERKRRESEKSQGIYGLRNGVQGDFIGAEKGAGDDVGAGRNAEGPGGAGKRLTTFPLATPNADGRFPNPVFHPDMRYHGAFATSDGRAVADALVPWDPTKMRWGDKYTAHTGQSKTLLHADRASYARAPDINTPKPQPTTPGAEAKGPPPEAVADELAQEKPSPQADQASGGLLDYLPHLAVAGGLGTALALYRHNGKEEERRKARQTQQGRQAQPEEQPREKAAFLGKKLPARTPVDDRAAAYGQGSDGGWVADNWGYLAGAGGLGALALYMRNKRKERETALASQAPGRPAKQADWLGRQWSGAKDDVAAWKTDNPHRFDDTVGDLAGSTLSTAGRMALGGALGMARSPQGYGLTSAMRGAGYGLGVGLGAGAGTLLHNVSGDPDNLGSRLALQLTGSALGALGARNVMGQHPADLAADRLAAHEARLREARKRLGGSAQDQAQEPAKQSADHFREQALGMPLPAASGILAGLTGAATSTPKDRFNRTARFAATGFAGGSGWKMGDMVREQMQGPHGDAMGLSPTDKAMWGLAPAVGGLAMSGIASYGLNKGLKKNEADEKKREEKAARLKSPTKRASDPYISPAPFPVTVDGSQWYNNAPLVGAGVGALGGGLAGYLAGGKQKLRSTLAGAGIGAGLGVGGGHLYRDWANDVGTAYGNKVQGEAAAAPKRIADETAAAETAAADELRAKYTPELQNARTQGAFDAIRVRLDADRAAAGRRITEGHADRTSAATTQLAGAASVLAGAKPTTNGASRLATALGVGGLLGGGALALAPNEAGDDGRRKKTAWDWGSSDFNPGNWNVGKAVGDGVHNLGQRFGAGATAASGLGGAGKYISENPWASAALIGAPVGAGLGLINGLTSRKKKRDALGDMFRGGAVGALAGGLGGGAYQMFNQKSETPPATAPNPNETVGAAAGVNDAGKDLVGGKGQNPFAKQVGDAFKDTPERMEQINNRNRAQEQAGFAADRVGLTAPGRQPLNDALGARADAEARAVAAERADPNDPQATEAARGTLVDKIKGLDAATRNLAPADVQRIPGAPRADGTVPNIAPPAMGVMGGLGVAGQNVKDFDRIDRDLVGKGMKPYPWNGTGAGFGKDEDLVADPAKFDQTARDQVVKDVDLRDGLVNGRTGRGTLQNALAIRLGTGGLRQAARLYSGGDQNRADASSMAAGLQKGLKAPAPKPDAAGTPNPLNPLNWLRWGKDLAAGGADVGKRLTGLGTPAVSPQDAAGNPGFMGALAATRGTGAQGAPMTADQIAKELQSGKVSPGTAAAVGDLAKGKKVTAGLEKEVVGNRTVDLGKLPGLTAAQKGNVTASDGVFGAAKDVSPKPESDGPGWLHRMFSRSEPLPDLGAPKAPPPTTLTSGTPGAGTGTITASQFSPPVAPAGGDRPVINTRPGTQGPSPAPDKLVAPIGTPGAPQSTSVTSGDVKAPPQAPPSGPKVEAPKPLPTQVKLPRVGPNPVVRETGRGLRALGAGAALQAASNAAGPRNSATFMEQAVGGKPGTFDVFGGGGQSDGAKAVAKQVEGELKYPKPVPQPVQPPPFDPGVYLGDQNLRDIAGGHNHTLLEAKLQTENNLTPEQAKQVAAALRRAAAEKK